MGHSPQGWHCQGWWVIWSSINRQSCAPSLVLAVEATNSAVKLCKASGGEQTVPCPSPTLRAHSKLGGLAWGLWAPIPPLPESTLSVHSVTSQGPGLPPQGHPGYAGHLAPTCSQWGGDDMSPPRTPSHPQLHNLQPLTWLPLIPGCWDSSPPPPPSAIPVRAAGPAPHVGFKAGVGGPGVSTGGQGSAWFGHI